ncbi:hypothetical protein ACVGW4_02270, partial [Enterobacter hormaechei]
FYFFNFQIIVFLGFFFASVVLHGFYQNLRFYVQCVGVVRCFVVFAFMLYFGRFSVKHVVLGRVLGQVKGPNETKGDFRGVGA